MEIDNPTMLVIGAHPDDCEFSAGGTAHLWARAGRGVHLLSLTNGDAGHHQQWGASLAARRRAEASAAARVLGVTSDIWDTHDGYLTPTVALRLRLIRTIRRLQPTVIICPRVWDYHPDHRAAAQLVQDAAYLLMVPGLAAEVPPLKRMPLILSCWDAFQAPLPFCADVVVDIAPVLPTKAQALACHTSQVFEWLPYVGGLAASVPNDAGGRLAMLKAALTDRARAVAETCTPADERAPVSLAEAFQLSEYGARAPLNDLVSLITAVSPERA